MTSLPRTQVKSESFGSGSNSRRTARRMHEIITTMNPRERMEIRAMRLRMETWIVQRERMGRRTMITSSVILYTTKPLALYFKKTIFVYRGNLQKQQAQKPVYSYLNISHPDVPWDERKNPMAGIASRKSAL